MRTCDNPLCDNVIIPSGTWPKWGMMRNGVVSRRQRLVLTSEAKGSLSLPVVPRPTASDGKGSGRIRYERLSQGLNLRDWFNMNYGFAYPPVRVNEYLMGFPIGWTDLEPSETQSYLKSQK